MTTISELLAKHQVVLMDGGMGSTVEDRGIPVRNHLWGSYALLTDEGRAVNDRLHGEFREAGARVLTANTHNAILENCEAFVAAAPEADLPRQVLDLPASQRAEGLFLLLHARAVASVRKAIAPGEDVVVAAGMGSPEGPYATESTHSPEEIAAAHAPQIRVYREVGVDLVLFETLTTAQEIEGVARLARRERLGRFGVGFTCGDDGRTMAGVSMAEAVDLLSGAAPEVWFVQCTPLQWVEPALAALTAALPDDAVRGVYANDGRVWIDMLWHGERTTPDEYAEQSARWLEMGIRVLGGCCGTDPRHIGELARRFDL